MPSIFGSKKLLFLTLFLITVLTRFAWLGNLPKGLHADEASFLLNTQSILLTGADEDNQQLPLWFNSYIDSKPALYSYLQLPFVSSFGFTTSASRLPAAFLGLVSIGLSYWVVSLLTNRKVALIATILLTFSPWHMIVSRSTQEVILAFTLSLVAVGSFLSAYRSLNQRHKMIWLALFLFSSLVCMYTYHSYKIFLPALLLGWSFIEIVWRKNESKNSVPISFIVVPMLSLIGLAGLLTFAVPQSLERFNAINVFQEQGPALVAEEQVRRATGVTPLFLLRVFYNKVVSYSLSVISIYAQHFTFDFFFANGGQPTRYRVPFHGLLYLIEVTLLPLGLFLSLHQPRYRKWGVLMLWWLLIAPIPAALTTQEIPSTIRSFPMIIPLYAFMASSMLWIWKRKHFAVSKVALVVLILGYIWGVAYFTQQFGVQQAHYQPWHRNTAEEKLAKKLVSVENEYDLIHISTAKDFYTYLTLEQPSLIPLLQAEPLARKNDDFILGKYQFNQHGCGLTTYSQELNVLHVLKRGCDLPSEFKIIEVIGYDDKAQVYDLVIFSPDTKTLEIQ